jgi:hypothetical protein
MFHGANSMNPKCECTRVVPKELAAAVDRVVMRISNSKASRLLGGLHGMAPGERGPVPARVLSHATALLTDFLHV